jgi:surface protein
MSDLVLTYTSPAGGFALTLPISTTGGTLTNVDWGDGTTPDTSYSHTYTNVSSTSYTVTITGTGFTQLSQIYSGATAPEYLTGCSSFGEIGLTDLSNAFNGCILLTSVPTSLPTTSTVTNMSYMFRKATSFNQDISTWDFSTVTNMTGMFSKPTAYTTRYMTFNQEITSWDVSNVTDMNDMFIASTAFNNGDTTNAGSKPLSWGSKTSKVINMSSMFGGANSFNQTVTSWDVSSVTNMNAMFSCSSALGPSGTSVFNNGDTTNIQGNALTWGNNTRFVTNMGSMFHSATSFNQDISGWDVSNVTNMAQMFQSATSFNQNLNSWDVSKVTILLQMFFGATSFNGNITNWVFSSSLTSMNSMFRSATSFNQNIGGWTVSNVTDMSQMFNGATSFNQNIGSWTVSKVTTMLGMFRTATLFNQDLSNWNITSVTAMTNMFSDSGISETNYNNILNGWGAKSVKSSVTFGVLGLVYSSSSAIAGRNTLKNTYSWTILGDALVSTDTIVQNSSFNLTINVNSTLVTNNIPYQLYYLSTALGSPITYTTGSTTLDFTGLTLSTAGTLPVVLKNNNTSATVATYDLDVSSGGSITLVCFKEDTKILTDHGYIPIQYLRKGDLIQTLNHGFVPINMIGKKEIHHPCLEQRIKDQLYKCSQDKYPEVFEDLVITGCHSILVKGFKDDEERENTIRINGNTYVTDDHYRLPSCVDDRTSVYEKEGFYTIYHVALDHDNYLMNYGIYANGLLVESCSQRYIKELSGMTLI